MSEPVTEEEQLAGAILRSTDSDDVVSTTLKTSERVLARVTDGIYRQPGSALRELVANAYDADAASVVVRTDRPRFSQISVEDDGAGMTPETVAHLLLNIGGSAKRQTRGTELGVTAVDDPMSSPGGRRLIGRIGIGLFSVSQLTQSFQITTKVAGDRFRTIATVALKTYGDESGPGTEDDGAYEAGRVNIWREPAADVDSHGTSIVLDNIRPQTRRTLQSDSIWAAVEAAEARPDDDELEAPDPPRFHIGRVVGGTDGADQLRSVRGEALDSVPWSRGDTPEEAFSALVDSVWDAVGEPGGNPKLATLFDFYLQTVWQLALSLPLPYVDGHPFATRFGGDAYTYEVFAGRDASPKRVELGPEDTLAERCDLRSAHDAASSPFSVLVDDLRLARPLRFTDLPVTGHALTQPIILAGKCREEFSGVPRALSGGPLEFEAYLLWNPKIAPTEHQGSLVRIHEASGTLFDPTFMRYQVSEQTRRQQTSCEIFVSEGLEGALNIDRESFNYAHPHVVYLTSWLHNALRKLATTQKSLAAGVRNEARQRQAEREASQLDTIAREAWTAATGDEDVVPPVVVLSDETDLVAPAVSADRDRLVLGRERILGSEVRARSVSGTRTERQVSAIASILAAYGVPDRLTAAEFEELLTSVRRVIDEAGA